jgi:SET domain
MLTNIDFELIEKTLNVILPEHYKEFHLTRQDLISELRTFDDYESFILSTNCSDIIRFNKLLNLPRKTGFLKDKLWISSDEAFSYTFMNVNNDNTTIYFIQNNQEEDEHLKWTRGGEYDFSHINWEEQMKWSNLEELVVSSIEFILLNRATEDDFPQNLTIEPKTEGIGLFSTENIDANTNLGIGWIKNDKFENGWIRTPIGGFVNHSDFPNCAFRLDKSGNFISLVTIKDIAMLEELTSNFKENHL